MITTDKLINRFQLFVIEKIVFNSKRNYLMSANRVVGNQ